MQIWYHAPSRVWSTATESCNLWSKRSTSKPPRLDMISLLVFFFRNGIPSQAPRGTHWLDISHISSRSSGRKFRRMGQRFGQLSRRWVTLLSFTNTCFCLQTNKGVTWHRNGRSSNTSAPPPTRSQSYTDFYTNSQICPRAWKQCSNTSFRL